MTVLIPDAELLAKASEPDAERRFGGLRRLHGLRIFVEDGQPPLTGQLLEDQTRMAAAPEGGVHIMAVRVDGQRLHGLVQQDGLVNPCALHHRP